MRWERRLFAIFSRGSLGPAWILACGLALAGCMTADKGQAVSAKPEIPAGGVPLLLTAEDKTAPEPAANFPEEKRIRIALLDPALGAEAGARLRSAKRFVFNPFDDVHLAAEVESSESPETGRFTLRGRLAAVEGSYFLLTYNQGALSAAVFHPGRGHYEIEATGGFTARVSEYDPARLPRLSHGMVFPEGPAHVHGAGMDPAMPLRKAGAGTPVLDILILYTPAAAAGAGGETAMLSRIDKAVAEVNTAFGNSLINAKLNLARAQQINYTETNNMGTDLGRLQKAGDGFLDDVPALRSTYKADFVSLIVEASGGGVAGIGYVMTAAQPWFKDYAFTVVGRAYTGSYHTLAHELGHNLGCNHDRQNSSGQAAFPYSYGHRFNGGDGKEYRDIMAYSPGIPIPYFSNPDVLYQGVPTGVPDGQPNSADNARTINATAPAGEAFFIRPAGQPPVPAISSPAASLLYSGGAVISFSGSASDPEEGVLPASAFTWQTEFHHDGIVDAKTTVASGASSGSFTVPNRGPATANAFYRLYLTVKDASGLAATAQRDIHPLKADLALASEPPGLQLKVDGQTVTTPYRVSGVAGVYRNVEAVSPQNLSGSAWTFTGWSDGAAQSREFPLPATGLSATAAFAGAAPGWTHRDIGTPGLPGGFSVSGGTYTLKASGYDIWNQADAFHYAWQTLSGDGMITARVVSLQNTHPWAMAGVMIRENISAGSRHAFMAASIGHGLTLHVRETVDGASREVPSAGAAPVWVRLVRSGPSLKGYASEDGVTWTLRGETVQYLPQDVLIGLALTSHDDAVLNTTAFDNVSIAADAWKSTDIGQVANAGSATGYAPMKVIGDGADIWNSSDAFFYRHRPLSGDGAIQARITAIGNTDPWAKAGVMIRESNAPGARHVSLFVTAANGIAFQRRESAGGISLHAGIAGAVPAWLRLVRAGDVFTASWSADGANWTQVGSATVPMAASASVGAAVTSHRYGTANAATFDAMTVTD